MPPARIAAAVAAIFVLAFMFLPWGSKSTIVPVEAGNGASVLTIPLGSNSQSDPGADDGTSQVSSGDLLQVDRNAPSDGADLGESESADSAELPAGEQPDDATASPGVASDVPLVIYDTDMGPDTDDVLALAMLHSYQKRGMIEIAAVTVSRNSVAGAKYTDAVNTFYGRPNIPIGVYTGATTYFNDADYYVSTADSWPQDVANTPLLEGYRVQRQVLADARADGRRVLIIQTGFAGNAARLINSGPDDISSLSGIDLVNQTVDVLSVMAGSIEKSIVEFNVKHDVESAKQLFARWPAPLALSPYELGENILYPYWSITSDFNWTDRHPVREAYEYSDLQWHQDAYPYYNMRSWDLTSVIEAVEPDVGYFMKSAPGTVNMDWRGMTTFSPGNGNHYVLDRQGEYSAGHRQWIVDRMIELTSDQP